MDSVNKEIYQNMYKGSVSLSQDDIDIIAGKMEDAQFHLFEGTTATVCCITLPSGLVVIGTSICADKTIFNEELGRVIAFANAKSKIFDLERKLQEGVFVYAGSLH